MMEVVDHLQLVLKQMFGKVLEAILSQRLRRIWKSKMETTKFSENDCQEIIMVIEEYFVSNV